MENIRIGIVGNIGVGKSTIVDAAIKGDLADLLLSSFPNRDGTEKVYAFPENFNPLVLDAFYADPVSNAFMAQIEFFNGRLERQYKIENSRGIILEDRTLAEDYHIFGLAQRILGNMTEAEFQAYQRTYEMMSEKVPEPDLMVYLKADVPTLMRRIQERGRESETTIPENYIKTLNELYELFVIRETSAPVLTIDANVKLGEGGLETYLQDTIQKVTDKIKDLDLRITTPGISDWVTLPQTEATLKAIEAEKQLESYLQQNLKLITVAGNVGLGKSTLTAVMERSLGLKGLYENPLDNPLLEKFLGDKATHCYELQKHFLGMRAEQRLKGKNGDASYVKDRSFPEDLLVFCYQFHKDGYLTSSQLDSLTADFKRVSNDLPPADLMVVLQGTPELSWKRIQQRGREMEMEGGWKYNEIKALSEWYKSYPQDVKKFGFHDSPVLEINANKLDLTNRIHMGYIFEQIYEKLNE